MTNKEFKTIKELVGILNSRGIETNKSTESALERESYYAIVNGYKKPFLDRKAMQSAPDDVYLPGTRFDWIYSLFLFDRDLRLITFKYLTMAEAEMRTAVAYAFCESHREKDAYLDRSNFCAADEYLVPKAFKGDKAKLHTDNLNDLMKRLNDKLVLKRETREFIKHYVNAYGTVPLWVLANDLTFGNVVHFYQLMKPRDRRKVCTIIARVAGRDSKESGTLSERQLLHAATVLKYFRNICAHDERLYCARYNNEGLAFAVAHLYTFLPEADTDAYLGDMVGLFNQYKDRIHNMEFSDFKAEMGIPGKK